MSKETELQETALGWIAELPKGYFYSKDVDRFLEETFPTECGKRGYTSNEPRYRNDARWEVCIAKD